MFKCIRLKMTIGGSESRSNRERERAASEWLNWRLSICLPDVCLSKDRRLNLANDVTDSKSEFQNFRIGFSDSELPNEFEANLASLTRLFYFVYGNRKFTSKIYSFHFHRVTCFPSNKTWKLQKFCNYNYPVDDWQLIQPMRYNTRDTIDAIQPMW